MEDHSHEFAVTSSIITDRSTKHEPLASACTESFLENTDTTFKLELTRVSDIGKKRSKRVLESEEDEAVTTCKHDARKRKSGYVLSSPHGNTTERIYKCSICYKAFKRLSRLKRHSIVHSDERPFKCSLCSKGFKTSCKLKRHKRIVHTDKRPFNCGTCDKAFKSWEEVKSHSVVHSEERPYKCTQCEKCFKTSSSLAMHVEKLWTSGGGV